MKRPIKKIKAYTMGNGTKLDIDWVEDFDGMAIENYTGILLDSRLSPARFREVAIHEMLHACDFNKSEKVVKRTAKEIERFLRLLGLFK
jgi:hypothetical protein